MKTLTFNAYTFSELSDAAKEFARDWFRQSSGFDADYVTNDAKQIGAMLGLSEMQIFWTGCSSQGDGACFSARWQSSAVKIGGVKDYAPQDKELHRIAAEFERISGAFQFSSFTVQHRGHYYHENCTEFAMSITDSQDNEIETPAAIQAEKDLIVAAKDFMRWIYRTLEKEYTWQNEDEQVDENISCNDYLFTETGRRTVVLNQAA